MCYYQTIFSQFNCTILYTFCCGWWQWRHSMCLWSYWDVVQEAESTSDPAAEWRVGRCLLIWAQLNSYRDWGQEQAWTYMQEHTNHKTLECIRTRLKMHAVGTCTETVHVIRSDAQYTVCDCHQCNMSPSFIVRGETGGVIYPPSPCSETKQFIRQTGSTHTVT